MGVETYWLLAVISSVILVILVVLSLIGVDVDELDIDAFGDAFSFNSLVAFVCVGSWTGYLANQSTSMAQWTVLALSVFVGLLAYVGSIFLLRKLKGWESQGNIQLSNAIGKVGTVYLEIPGNKSDPGQIQITIQGRLKTLYAITPGEKIKTGTTVIVFDIEENRLVVEPYDES